MTFDNSYARLPERFYSRVEPASVPAPVLLAFNDGLAGELGLDALADGDEALAAVFAGNQVPAGAEPIALAYAGHQFGQFVPQLGDGRAVLLGEVVGADSVRHDVQLKGAGRTPYSRGGDGRSSIGPVIREYLLSEAMHALGVPTTRALAAVYTGQKVYRDTALPGGVFTRVAASHIRIGTFEYFAARGDVAGLKTLADYAISRHYPELADDDRPYAAFFSAVVAAQVRLVAHWMDIGFIHGVMNTDNTAVSGETLDYGPCAFMDEFHANKVFSSIDHGGRYSYANQPQILQWNLARLAECLLLLDTDRRRFETELMGLPSRYEAEYLARMRRKLGFTPRKRDDSQGDSNGNSHDDPRGDSALLRDWLRQLQKRELDYTLSFRELADRIDASDAPRFGTFETDWKQRLATQGESGDQIRARMNSVNPLFIPRNHQIERAIQGAIEGNLSVFHELREVLSRPFETQPQFAEYAQPPLPGERVTQTFCGT